jgi:hypothetical protein
MYSDSLILKLLLANLILVGASAVQLFPSQTMPSVQLKGSLINPIGDYSGALKYSQSRQQQEADRARELARREFAKNFRDLQQIGYGLLREHEAGRLSAKRLAKDVRAIHKCAQALRRLMALGEQEVELAEKIKPPDTPKEFDLSIRRLVRSIYAFAHSPFHRNSKIFDMDEAARVQAELLTILDMTRAIESNARSYAVLSQPSSSPGEKEPVVPLNQ